MRPAQKARLSLAAAGAAAATSVYPATHHLALAAPGLASACIFVAVAASYRHEARTTDRRQQTRSTP